MASPTKDLNELKRIATSQGWEVLDASGGHLRWVPPDGGDYVATSSTPSDSNIIKTIKKDLANAGLVLDKAQAKRLKRAVKTGQPVRLKATRVQDGINADNVDCDVSDEAILVALEKEMPELFATISHSSQRKNIACRMIREWGSKGEFPLECATCGRTWTEPLGLATHIFKNCPDHEPKWNRQPKETSVDRNMTAPPERERLNCPYCPEWFWVSQDEALDKHTRGEHGRASCPFCKDYFFVNKGGLDKHMRACRSGPDRLAALESSKAQAVAAANDEPPLVPFVGTIANPAKPQPAPMADSPVRGSDWNADPCPGGCGSPVGDSNTSHCEPCQKVLDELAVERDTKAAMEAKKLATAASAIEAVPMPEEVFPEPSSFVEKYTQSERSVEMTDDELFTLLEVVLDGPVMVTRESLAAINDWMDATKRLLTLKDQS